MTSFSENVLKLVKKIPKTKVTTYKIIAKKLNSKAYRAVGSAIKKNDRPIIIPCHRVVKSDGDVGEYSGKNGTKGKINLLRREGIIITDKKIENFKKVLYKL